MKNVLRFNAGILNEFRLTLEGKYGKTQESLIDYITKPFKMSQLVLNGMAFHKIVELGERWPCIKEKVVTVPDSEGGRVSFPLETYQRALALHAEYAGKRAMFERWKGGVIDDTGGTVIGSLGKQDVRVLDEIHDVKTTGRQKEYMDYWDEVQWHLYLMLEPAANSFVYRVFTWDDGLNILSEDTFRFNRTDVRPEHVIGLANQLVSFLDTHGLTDRYILPEGKYFTIGL